MRNKELSEKILKDLESGLINSKQAFVLLSEISKKDSVKNYQIEYLIGSKGEDRITKNTVLTLNENDKLNEMVQQLLASNTVYSSYYQEYVYARLIKVSLID